MCALVDKMFIIDYILEQWVCHEDTFIKFEN